MEFNLSDSIARSKILIVDDNPQNLQVLAKILQEKNFEIEFATSGIGAMEWLENQKFDLILLDINMPEIDGFEVCKRIRKKKQFNHMPIIFLTADINRESILKGFKCGAQDYVTKPFDSGELIERVNTHLTLKKSLEQLEQMNNLLDERVKERTEQLSRANKKLEEMNKQLLNLDEAKAEFLRLISHEIRTPLNGILGPLQILKQKNEIIKQNVLFNILDISVNRLEKFAMNALLITRLQTKQYKIVITNLDIIQIIQSLIDDNKSKLQEKDLEVNLNIKKSFRMIKGQSDLVNICIKNIIENAIYFSPDKGKITIDVFNEENFSIIEISDEGNGFPEEIIKKGSKPFSPGLNYRDKSIGIGLPISNLIMDAHKGFMEIKNIAEGGAKVSLKFKKNL